MTIFVPNHELFLLRWENLSSFLLTDSSSSSSPSLPSPTAGGRNERPCAMRDSFFSHLTENMVAQHLSKRERGERRGIVLVNVCDIHEKKIPLHNVGKKVSKLVNFLLLQLSPSKGGKNIKYSLL